MPPDVPSFAMDFLFRPALAFNSFGDVDSLVGTGAAFELGAGVRLAHYVRPYFAFNLVSWGAGEGLATNPLLPDQSISGHQVMVGSQFVTGTGGFNAALDVGVGTNSLKITNAKDDMASVSERTGTAFRLGFGFDLRPSRYVAIEPNLRFVWFGSGTLKTSSTVAGVEI